MNMALFELTKEQKLAKVFKDLLLEVANKDYEHSFNRENVACAYANELMKEVRQYLGTNIRW